MVKIAMFWGLIIILTTIFADLFFYAKAKNPKTTFISSTSVIVILILLGIGVCKLLSVY